MAYNDIVSPQRSTPATTSCNSNATLSMSSTTTMKCTHEVNDRKMNLQKNNDSNNEKEMKVVVATLDETLLFLAGLVQQEERSYAKYPCLLVQSCSSTNKRIRHQQQEQHTRDDTERHNPSMVDYNHDYVVDVDCRTAMIEWCYQIVNFSKINRECVEITMSYVDRYVATCNHGQLALQDRSIYQLLFMTALYVAVKIHDDQTILDPQMISAFSRGTYTISQVVEMEQLLLSVLQWKLNPPTTVSYINLFHELIPETIVCSLFKQHVYQLAIQSTEIALMDYPLMSTKPSIIAYCSYMNALEYLAVSGMMIENDTGRSSSNDTSKVLAYVGYSLAQAIDVADSNDPYIILVQHRLYESQYDAYHRQQQAERLVGADVSEAEASAVVVGQRNESSCIVVSPTTQECSNNNCTNIDVAADKKKEGQEEESPRMVADIVMDVE